MRPRLAILVVALGLCTACGGGSSGGSGIASDHLSVKTPSTSSCEGAYTPGQSVEISDPRFAPGIEVTLTITPPSGEALTSILTADQNGTVDSTIQLPQAAGSAYINVSGMSPTGEQVNDAVGIDLLAAGSPCPS